jgi:hypothetical protein
MMGSDMDFACQASRSFLALAFGDVAGFAGARGTGGDVTLGPAA